MFSDILTPFPAMGVEFDVIKGRGPTFPAPVRTAEDIRGLKVRISKTYRQKVQQVRTFNGSAACGA